MSRLSIIVTTVAAILLAVAIAFDSQWSAGAGALLLMGLVIYKAISLRSDSRIDDVGD